MAVYIAFAALLVSLFALILNRKNQAEQRHGEITKLRSDFLTKLSIIQPRITSNLLLTETARLELRGVVDSNDKFETIEKMPKMIQMLKETSISVNDLISKFKKFDSEKQNRSNVLIGLQSMSHEIKIIEDTVVSIENNLLSFVEQIQSKQKPIDSAPTSKKAQPGAQADRKG